MSQSLQVQKYQARPPNQKIVPSHNLFFSCQLCGTAVVYLVIFWLSQTRLLVEIFEIFHIPDNHRVFVTFEELYKWRVRLRDSLGQESNVFFQLEKNNFTKFWIGNFTIYYSIWWKLSNILMTYYLILYSTYEAKFLSKNYNHHTILKCIITIFDIILIFFWLNTSKNVFPYPHIGHNLTKMFFLNHNFS